MIPNHSLTDNLLMFDTDVNGIADLHLVSGPRRASSVDAEIFLLAGSYPRKGLFKRRRQR